MPPPTTGWLDRLASLARAIPAAAAKAVRPKAKATEEDHELIERVVVTPGPNGVIEEETHKELRSKFINRTMPVHEEGMGSVVVVDIDGSEQKGKGGCGIAWYVKAVLDGFAYTLGPISAGFAERWALLVVIVYLLHNKDLLKGKQRLVIRTDSQDVLYHVGRAIRTLGYCECFVLSWAAGGLGMLLEDFKDLKQIDLIWGKGHHVGEANEAADVLAKRGALSTLPSHTMFCPLTSQELAEAAASAKKRKIGLIREGVFLGHMRLFKEEAKASCQKALLKMKENVSTAELAAESEKMSEAGRDALELSGEDGVATHMGQLPQIKSSGGRLPEASDGTLGAIARPANLSTVDGLEGGQGGAEANVKKRRDPKRPLEEDSTPQNDQRPGKVPRIRGPATMLDDLKLNMHGQEKDQHPKGEEQAQRPAAAAPKIQRRPRPAKDMDLSMDDV